MDDWNYCRAALREVSRSFSLPIRMLRPELERAVTVGYLLCRAADTVEDLAELTPERRQTLFGVLLEVLGGASPEPLVRAAGEIEGDDPERALLRGSGRVVAVLRELPAGHQAATRRWVAEMVRGMALYAHRPAERGLVALTTLHDLERYCYFVAGTVGHLLTDLFVDAAGIPADHAEVLRGGAEDFGLGLQLTNILKDVAEDHGRGWCFVPRTLCSAAALNPADLLLPERRHAAHRALAPVFERATRALDGALEYTLAIPAEASDIRMFCLLPLWMAVRTLERCRLNDDVLRGDRVVKIPRDEVEQMVVDCTTHCGDDAALRAGFARLRDSRARYVA